MPDILDPILDYWKPDLENSYTVSFLDKPDGNVPAGWAAFYKGDGEYVGWALPSEDIAWAYATGHLAGMRHLGAKF